MHLPPPERHPPPQDFRGWVGLGWGLMRGFFFFRLMFFFFFLLLAKWNRMYAYAFARTPLLTFNFNLPLTLTYLCWVCDAVCLSTRLTAMMMMMMILPFFSTLA